ncbi:hypothetical protein CEP54_008567 [Fusarium duplospermum]|uniref:Uncharacterized protein n=1 Tax=Fusarium duplospermum TaxID=1325734 RepID=A0A428PV20_9HYPO|nr:hypothetical protein CEP54_008567 [Fusarium duplospermum]
MVLMDVKSLYGNSMRDQARFGALRLFGDNEFISRRYSNNAAAAEYRDKLPLPLPLYEQRFKLDADDYIDLAILWLRLRGVSRNIG